MVKRKYPIGAEITPDGIDFRVWAPLRQKVDVVINDISFPLHPEEQGYFSALITSVKPHDLYLFYLDGERRGFPDPASRYQPDGPHGKSEIIDYTQFSWNDSSWKGIVDKEKVILYELHIGTFTKEGTWLSAIDKLPHLLELGINVIEMMPVNEFCGRFNWGYDGVNLFAPTHNYGHPDDLRRFIDAAHALGIGVILDVVYNHFGPDGNYLRQFSEGYLKKQLTEWGDAIDFDKKEVRTFFITNALYWIEEFHFDGLRFDACHAILDQQHPHILAEMSEKIREITHRSTYLIAENEREEIDFIMPPQVDGYRLDAVWNEDFHHSAFVSLTGRHEGYFSDYLGNPQEFISSVKYSFLFQGQWCGYQQKHRGTPTFDIPAHFFVNFLENHDQVANSPGNLRLHSLCHPGSYRALTTLFLLMPQIPLLFQGQEWGSTAPFYYFSDHYPELAKAVYQGRVNSFSRFASFNDPEVLATVPMPHDEKTFLQSKLNWDQIFPSQLELYKDLIDLRKNDPLFSQFSHISIDGAVLNDHTFAILYRYQKEERLLLVNLGNDLFFDPAPEPLIAPHNGSWNLLFSSENPRYGGHGAMKIPIEGNWHITGHSATLFSMKIANTT